MSEQNYSGVDNFDSSEVRLNYRAVVQGTSNPGFTVMPGHFITKKLKQDHGPSMEVVILQAKKHRKLESEYKQGVRSEILCRSSDARTPDADVENPRSSLCQSCEHAKQDIIISMIMLDVKATLAEGVPVVFRYEAKKTGGTYAFNRFILDQCIAMKKAPKEFVVTLSSARDKAFFKVNITDPTMVSDKLKPFVDAAFAQFVSGEPVPSAEEPVDDSVDDGDGIPF